jgi:putative peptidoglycan lipid II flippase
MFAWGAVYILARGFYAASDTITPAVVGTVMTLVSLPLYWVLVRRFQYRGLALASSLGIVVYALALFLLLNRRTKNRGKNRLGIFFFKVMAASSVAGLGCYEVAEWLGNRPALQRPLGSFILLVIASSAGIVLLSISLKILRVREVGSYLEQAISFAVRAFRRAPEGA